MFFAIIFSIFCVISAEETPTLPQGRPLFVIPEKIIGDWTIAGPTDFKCPPPHADEITDGLLKSSITLYRQMSHQEITPVKGHLCTGYLYTIHCSENFFGTKSLTKKISHHEATFSDCLKAFKQVNEGDYIDPYFPEPDCVWMGDRDTSLTFVVVEEHPVRFDPYHMSLVDGMFEGGKCNTDKCNTLHQSTIWVSEEKIGKKCSQYESSKGIIFKDKKNKPKYIQWGDHKLSSLNNTCNIVYCGIVGLRLNNGLFLGTKEFNSNFPQCPDSTSVAFQPKESLIEELETRMQNFQDRFECLDAVQSLRMSGKVSFLDLAKLTPQYPGHHFVFRINNLKVEKAMAEWVALYKFKIDDDFNKIGLGLNDKPMGWPYWVDSGMGFKSGFNGVHKDKSGKIIIPNIELLKMEYSESLMLEHLMSNVDHPVADLAEKEGMDDTLVTSSDHQITNIGEWIGRVWSSLTGKIVMIALIIVGSVSGVYLLINLPKLCKKKQKPQEIELTSRRRNRRLTADRLLQRDEEESQL